MILARGVRGEWLKSKTPYLYFILLAEFLKVVYTKISKCLNIHNRMNQIILKTISNQISHQEQLSYQFKKDNGVFYGGRDKNDEFMGGIVNTF